ncbi:hypothetical protein MTBSS4_280009 [Magnetospirillum sp. SS-4]|nr:hypothetical protein MTBSS4_280009 [Magnetospirillum sp. SS-4]
MRRAEEFCLLTYPQVLGRWRPRPELNRRTRICSPLHSHSATRPDRPIRPGADVRTVLIRADRFPVKPWFDVLWHCFHAGRRL